MNETFRDTHARFPALLADDLLHLLDVTESALVESHARECAECGELLARARARRADWWEGTGHATVRALSTFASTPDALPAADRDVVARHLEHCEECREDLRVLTAGVASAAPIAPADAGPGDSGGRSHGLVWAFAGGLAAVLLVFVFMNPSRAPDPGVAVQPEVRQPSGSVTPPAGAPRTSGTPERAPVAVAMEPVALEGASRGTGESGVAASVAIPGGAADVPFTLPALFVDEGTTFVIELRDANRVMLFRDEIAAARALAPAGVRIPAARFRAGRLALRVAWVDAMGVAEAREYALDVSMPR
ncbi:MAG: hypothetical protein HZA61_04000 [Candidatus Eisenbacteria bacterium]|uniref:Zinc-finger domain-containing protein n=1 Tax=Eiseniibacteriota bacterium TaxID=2212470 RepID=A0A933S9V4_UNCEI|nr:hypothetical protein [Candidatus Eisenbacteria bacterium]